MDIGTKYDINLSVSYLHSYERELRLFDLD